jgi:hypothetical protein
MDEECPFVSKLFYIIHLKPNSFFYSIAKPQCFSLTDKTTSPNGTEISVKNLQIGEKVLAIDDKDKIISTEIISILHYENNSQGKILKKRIYFSKLSS